MMKVNLIVLLVVLAAFSDVIRTAEGELLSFFITNKDKLIFFSAIPQCNEVCGRPEDQQHACCNANGYYAGIGCRDGQMFCGPPY